MFPSVEVPVPVIMRLLVTPRSVTEALVAYKFVVEATLEKSVVDVALPKITGCES
jgi:hypothetical protein